MDFPDIEHYALEILVKKENGKLIYTDASEEFSRRFEEILIDEYQGWYEIQKAWPESVTFRQQEDGSYLFTLKTASSYGLMKWIMSMGSSATLVKPENMREQVKEELESMIQSYKE